MAIYHASIKTISRSTGRSATAAAAYRAGERVCDDRTGEVHDYTRRTGVEYTELVGWGGTRAELWNAAEAAERRCNGRTARELVIALPGELSPEGRIQAARSMAQSLRARYGVAVDLAVHAPGGRGDPRNNHAHLLVTVRAVSESGEIGAKTRTLDDRVSGPQEIEWIRARWEVVANWCLEHQGCADRVDRRSLAAQGIDQEPDRHVGPRATALERRGVRTEIGDENTRRRQEAQERAVAARRAQEQSTREAEERQRVAAAAAEIERQRVARDAERATVERYRVADRELNAVHKHLDEAERTERQLPPIQRTAERERSWEDRLRSIYQDPEAAIRVWRQDPDPASLEQVPQRYGPLIERELRRSGRTAWNWRRHEINYRTDSPSASAARDAATHWRRIQAERTTVESQADQRARERAEIGRTLEQLRARSTELQTALQQLRTRPEVAQHLEAERAPQRGISRGGWGI